MYKLFWKDCRQNYVSDKQFCSSLANVSLCVCTACETQQILFSAPKQNRSRSRAQHTKKERVKKEWERKRKKKGEKEKADGRDMRNLCHGKFTSRASAISSREKEEEEKRDKKPRIYGWRVFAFTRYLRVVTPGRVAYPGLGPRVFCPNFQARYPGI